MPALGFVFLLVMAGACHRAPPKAATYRELRASTDSLLRLGEYQQAIDRLEDATKAPVAAAAWERAWARARAASIRPMLRLPAQARSVLQSADTPDPAKVEEGSDDWPWVRPALERQLEIRRRWLGPESPDLAETMAAMARLERRSGQAWRALTLNQDALAIRRRVYGQESPEVAASYLIIGRDHKLAGIGNGKAECYMDSSLALSAHLFGEESLEHAEVLLASGNVERWMARTAPAFQQMNRALAIRRRLEGPRSLGVAEVLTDLAVVHNRLKQWANMERLAGEAIAIEDERGDSVSSLSALSLNIRGLALRHQGRFQEARPVLERTCRVQEALRHAAPRVASVLNRFHLLAGYADLAMVEMALGDSAAAWTTQERGLSRLWLERAWERGEVDSARCWDHLLEQVQARLTDSSAVVGWLDPYNRPGEHGNPFWGYVIRRTGGVHWVRVEAAADDPRNSATNVGYALYHKLEVAAGWPFAIDEFADLDQLERDFCEMRFGAFEPLLKGVRELVVVSPSLNYRVPLEIVRDAQGRALSERFAISYSPSALHFACSPPAGRLARVQHRWRGILLRAPGRRSAGGEDDLRWADLEVRNLAGFLDQPSVLLGAAASEASLRRLQADGSLGKCDLLHIASHAQSELGWDHDVWLALAESGGNPRLGFGPQTQRDGLLSVPELAQWRLRAHLVTLSSCTSSGAFPNHTEGVFGLGQAFLQAGARSVLVSLWPVDDEATERLMHYFHAALFAPAREPCSVSEALRVARLRLRDFHDAEGRRPFEHPVYWGGFVLLGDPG